MVYEMFPVKYNSPYFQVCYIIQCLLQKLQFKMSTSSILMLPSRKVLDGTRQFESDCCGISKTTFAWSSISSWRQRLENFDITTKDWYRRLFPRQVHGQIVWWKIEKNVLESSGWVAILSCYLIAISANAGCMDLGFIVGGQRTLSSKRIYHLRVYEKIQKIMWTTPVTSFIYGKRSYNLLKCGVP